ncbi:early endosome antigen 1 [Biomphalaria glabrata]|nr:early endosome antigen 1 [Biomphalaria glabrata]
MDPLKRETLLQMIQSLWGKHVESLFDLRDGDFYFHVLRLLHHSPKDHDLETSEERLTFTHKFLQEIYGKDKIEKILNFNILLQNVNSLENNAVVELELSKIALVLYGIGVLDKNCKLFVETALKLPESLHPVIMSLINSVVQPGSMELSLTDNIEAVLLMPSDQDIELNPAALFTWLGTQTSVSLSAFAAQPLTCSPVMSGNVVSPEPGQKPPAQLFTSSTPRDSRRFSFAPSTSKKDRHSKAIKMAALNSSLSEITSPLKDLNLQAVSPQSPLLQFVQSPQVIQKATLNQKDMEIRQLKQRLSDESYLKDELQDQLRDQHAQNATKDSEIVKLQDRIKSLLALQDKEDELQELKIQFNELTSEYKRLETKLVDYDQCKESLYFLEKLTDEQRQELSTLSNEVKLLEAERKKNATNLETIRQLENRAHQLQSQLEDTEITKQAWSSEKISLQVNNQMLKDQNEQLRQELDNLLSGRDDSEPGESMGICLELQLRDLRCELEAMTSQHDGLQLQLKDMESEIQKKNQEIDILQERIKSLLTLQDEVDELRQLKIQFDELTSKHTRLETKLVDYDQCKESLHSLEKLTDEQRQELSTLSIEVKLLEGEREKNVETISQLENQLQLQLVDTEMAKQSWNSEKISMQANYEELKDQNEKLQSEQADTALQLCDLRSGLEAMTSQRNDLQLQLKDMEADLQMKDQEINTLQEERSKNLVALQDKEDELKELKIQLNELANDHERLGTKLVDYEQCKESLHSLEKLTDEQRRELSTLSNEVKLLEVERTKNVSNLETISQLENRLQLQLDDTEIAKQAWSSEKISMEANYQTLKDQCVQLQQEVVNLQAGRDETALQLCDLRSELEAMTSQRNGLQLQLKDMETDLQMKDQEINTLQEERSKNLVALQDKEDELRELKIQLNELTNEHKRLETKLVDYDQCKESLHSLEKLTDEQRQELSTLSSEVKLLEFERTKNVSNLETISQLESQLQLQLDDIDMAKQAWSSEKISMQTNYEVLKDQKEQLRQELINLRAGSDNTALQLCDLRSGLEAMTSQRNGLQLQLKDMETDLQMKDQEINTLQEEHSKNLVALQDKEDELRKLKIQLNELTSEHKRLETKLVDYDQCKESLHSLQKLTDEQRQELSTLSNEVKLLEVERMKNVTNLETISQLENRLQLQFDDTEIAKQAWSSEKISMEANYQMLKDQNEQLEQDLVNLRAGSDETSLQLCDLRSGLEMKDQEIITLQEERSKNLVALQDKEDELRELKIQLNELTREHKRLETKLVDYDQCKESLHSLEKLTDEQRQELSTLSNEVKLLEVERTKNASNLETISQLESQLQLQLDDIEMAKQAWSSEKISMQTNYEVLKDQNEQLRQELVNLRAGSDDTALQLCDLRSGLEAMTSQRNVLQLQLKDMEADLQMKDQEINTLQEERSKNLVALQDKEDKLKELNIQLNESTSEHKRLETKLVDYDQCKDSLHYLEKLTDEQRQELSTLSNEVKLLEVERTKNVTNLETISQLESQLQLQLDDMEMAKQAWNSEKISMQTNYEVLKDQNEQLRQELVNLRAGSDDTAVQLCDLRSGLEAMTSQRNVLQLQLKDMEADLEMKDQEINTLQEERSKNLVALQDKEDELNELKIQFNELTSEHERLETKLDDYDQCKESLHSLEKLTDEQRQELSTLSNEVKLLEVERTKNVSNLETISQLENQLQLQLDDIDMAKQAWSSEKISMQTNYEVLKDQNEKLRQELVNLRAGSDDTAVQLCDLRSGLEVMTSQRNGLQLQLKDMEADLQMKDQEINTLQEERNKNLVSLQDKEDKLRNIEIQLNELTSEHKRLETKLVDYDQCKESLHSLEKLTDEQRQELSTLSNEVKLLEVERTKNVSNLEIISQLESRLQLQFDDIEMAKQAWNSEKISMQTNYEVLKDQNEQLRQELVNLRAGSDDTAVQLCDLRSGHEAMTSQRNGLQLQLKDMEADLQMKDQEINTLQEERSKNLFTLQDKEDELRELKIQLNELTSEHKRLETKLVDYDQCKECLHSLEKLTDEQRQELSTLSNEVKLLEVERTKNVTNLETISQLESRLRLQLDDIEMAKQAWSSEKISMQTNYEVLKDQNEQLRQELVNLRAGSDDIAVQLCDLRSGLEAMTSQRNGLQLQLKDMGTDLQMKDQEINTLQEERSKNFLALQDKEDELRELKIQLNELTSEHKRLETKLVDYDQCKENLHSLEKLTDEQREELSTLSNEVKLLEVERTKNVTNQETINQLESQLQLQLDDIEMAKQAWNSEKMSMQTNNQMLKDQNEQLRQELDNLQAARDESMGILLEQQLQDLRSELEAMTLQRDGVQWQLKEMETDVQKKDQEIERLKTLLLQKDAEIDTLKAMLAQRNSEIETLQSNLVAEQKKSELVLTLKSENNRYKNTCKTLQGETATLREREKCLLNECDTKISKARDFCNDMRRQMEESHKKLEEAKKETGHFQEQAEKAEKDLLKMRSINDNLNSALKLEKETNSLMKKKMDSQELKQEEMRQRLESALKDNKQYVAEISRLKTAVDYSDRKIREYKHLLDHSGTVHLGDASHFRKVIEQEEINELENSISSVDSRRRLRSHKTSDDSLAGSSDETILSADKVMLRRDTLVSTSELKTKTNASNPHQTEDRLSLCSVSSAHSIRSKGDVPVGFLPNANSCANEPEDPDFEWDRLNELQRRNTLYLPHMKSAYPVEMQASRNRITDDSIRLSLMPEGKMKASPGRYNMRQKDSNSRLGNTESVDSRAMKRKATVSHQSSNEKSFESPAKQIKSASEVSPGDTILYYPVVRAAPVYQRPGPPTPGKQPRRISGRFTPSHGVSPAVNGKIKALGSPIARPNKQQIQGRQPSRRSPRLSHMPQPSSSTDENNRRESVAFNIGFTPGKSKGPKSFLQKTLFGSKSKTDAKGDDQVRGLKRDENLSLPAGQHPCDSGQVSCESIELSLNLIDSSNDTCQTFVFNLLQSPSKLPLHSKNRETINSSESNTNVPCCDTNTTQVSAVPLHVPAVPQYPPNAMSSLIQNNHSKSNLVIFPDNQRSQLNDEIVETGKSHFETALGIKALRFDDLVKSSMDQNTDIELISQTEEKDTNPSPGNKSKMIECRHIVCTRRSPQDGHFKTLRMPAVRVKSPDSTPYGTKSNSCVKHKSKPAKRKLFINTPHLMAEQKNSPTDEGSKTSVTDYTETITSFACKIPENNSPLTSGSDEKSDAPARTFNTVSHLKRKFESFDKTTTHQEIGEDKSCNGCAVGTCDAHIRAKSPRLEETYRDVHMTDALADTQEKCQSSGHDKANNDPFLPQEESHKDKNHLKKFKFPSFMKKAFNKKKKPGVTSQPASNPLDCRPNVNFVKPEMTKTEKVAQLKAKFEPIKKDVKRKEESKLIQAWLPEATSGSQKSPSHVDLPLKQGSNYKVTPNANPGHTAGKSFAHTPKTPFHKKLASRWRAHNKVTPVADRK